MADMDCREKLIKDDFWLADFGVGSPLRESSGEFEKFARIVNAHFKQKTTVKVWSKNIIMSFHQNKKSLESANV